MVTKYLKWCRDVRVGAVMEHVYSINMTTLIVSYVPVGISHCGRGEKESTK